LKQSSNASAIGSPPGAGALIASNPEPLNLPLRYLVIRCIEFTSVTGRPCTPQSNFYPHRGGWRSPTKAFSATILSWRNRE
jgi:hypothetical protein